MEYVGDLWDEMQYSWKMVSKCYHGSQKIFEELNATNLIYQ